MLTTNIDPDNGACSVALLQSAAHYFGLALAEARTAIKHLRLANSSWRKTAREFGALPAEITRTSSAFEHDGHRKA